MKIFRNITLLISSIAMLSLAVGCDDDLEELQVDATPVSPALSALDIDMIELDGANTQNPAATFQWAEADYGQQTAVNYEIQFSADDSFATPVTGGITTSNSSITLSMGELNSSAGNAGLPPFEWNTLYARVVSSLGTQSSIQAASNTIQFQVYPYFNYPFDDFYLVGNATMADWNNNNNNPLLFRDPSNSKKYYYTGFFADGAFKVLEVKGQWQPQWGTNDGASIEVNDGTGSDPGVFPVPSGAGFYQFEIDFAANAFSVTEFDASGAASLTSVGISGSATPGGSTETALTQSSFDSHIWYANSVRLTPGDLQFIADGSTAWGSNTEFSGQATAGGENIPVVVEDDYDVWFNDLTGRYIMVPINLSQS
ncbi:SusE domain-containing protein [Sungkyunkwania multivorans]|uniref:SusE domain-containing protein n=1 Tax=Sungkyunkwania multivorans TaxID=1173618 RepID=A0ABW3D0Y3_9FLAO